MLPGILTEGVEPVPAAIAACATAIAAPERGEKGLLPGFKSDLTPRLPVLTPVPMEFTLPLRACRLLEGSKAGARPESVEVVACDGAMRAGAVVEAVPAEDGGTFGGVDKAEPEEWEEVL